MRTINWKIKGSRKEKIDGIMQFPIYDCRIKVIDEEKLICWIDCTCWNFANRRLKSIGDFSDKKIIEIPCKHLKLAVDALLKLGYVLKVPKEMEGPDKLTSEVRRFVLERSGGICEVGGCFNVASRFHRIVRGSAGGKYTFENTKHLCAEHHKMVHANEFSGSKSK